MHQKAMRGNRNGRTRLLTTMGGAGKNEGDESRKAKDHNRGVMQRVIRELQRRLGDATEDHAFCGSIELQVHCKDGQLHRPMLTTRRTL